MNRLKGINQGLMLMRLSEMPHRCAGVNTCELGTQEVRRAQAAMGATKSRPGRAGVNGHTQCALASPGQEDVSRCILEFLFKDVSGNEVLLQRKIASFEAYQMQR